MPPVDSTDNHYRAVVSLLLVHFSDPITCELVFAVVSLLLVHFSDLITGE